MAEAPVKDLRQAAALHQAAAADLAEAAVEAALIPSHLLLYLRLCFLAEAGGLVLCSAEDPAVSRLRELLPIRVVPDLRDTVTIRPVREPRDTAAIRVVREPRDMAASPDMDRAVWEVLVPVALAARLPPRPVPAAF